MKKILACVLAGCLTLGFAGCSQPQPEQSSASQPTLSTDDTPTVTEPENTPVPMYSITLSPVKETVHADNGDALFSLSFQQPQLLLHDPALEEKIIGNLLERRGPVLAEAELMEAQARQDYPEKEDWSKYCIDYTYEPVRLDQTVLSLYCNYYSYCGGAHSSLVTDSVNYDLSTGEALFLDDILSEDCTGDTLYQQILAQLAPQEDQLYDDYRDALADRFSQGLHSIQNWYFSRKGLCFHFAPYDLGPYAAGTVTAELPYDSLSGILKDRYFPTEANQATGSMYVQTPPEDNADRFTFIAEVSLEERGTAVWLYPDAAVTDLRIESGFRNPDSDEYFARTTIFAANTMNVGDAIRLTADLTDEARLLRLVYRSDDQEYSVFITNDDASGSVALTNIL